MFGICGAAGSLFLGVFGPGCASRAVTGPASPEASTRLIGDWEDIDAAVGVGVASAECVVVRGTAAGSAELRYQIKHVSGRTGVLVARTDATAKDPRPIELECEFEPVRDTALESRIIRGVSRRLSELKGREFAPIGG